MGSAWAGSRHKKQATILCKTMLAMMTTVVLLFSQGGCSLFRVVVVFLFDWLRLMVKQHFVTQRIAEKWRDKLGTTEVTYPRRSLAFDPRKVAMSIIEPSIFSVVEFIFQTSGQYNRHLLDTIATSLLGYPTYDTTPKLPATFSTRPQHIEYTPPSPMADGRLTEPRNYLVAMPRS